jgi:hypothetical protein
MAQITIVPGERHIPESAGGRECVGFLEPQRPKPGCEMRI